MSITGLLNLLSKGCCIKCNKNLLKSEVRVYWTVTDVISHSKSVNDVIGQSRSQSLTSQVNKEVTVTKRHTKVKEEVTVTHVLKF